MRPVGMQHGSQQDVVLNDAKLVVAQGSQKVVQAVVQTGVQAVVQTGVQAVVQTGVQQGSQVGAQARRPQQASAVEATTNTANNATNPTIAYRFIRNNLPSKKRRRLWTAKHEPAGGVFATHWAEQRTIRPLLRS